MRQEKLANLKADETEEETMEMDNTRHDESDLQHRHNSGYLNVEIHPTTGGQFQLQIHKQQTVEQLKRIISRKLNLAKDKICLLYKDRDLRDGSLVDNQVVDGSKVTLLPIVETGLMCQKPEQSVLQALESLSDAQVNTFLEGKAPLNLTMRVGDHMMFIQLQLSTVGNGRLNRRQQQTGASSSSSSSSSNSNSSNSNSSSNVRRPPRVTAEGPIHMLDNRTLAEASRNLSQTLKHFSTQTKTSSSANTPSTTSNVNAKELCRGAIIESMQHHGRGVYSGTFSGTLNPALQDSNGNPKRDISTIIHILNDLLGASSSSHNSNRRHRATSLTKATTHMKTGGVESSVELSRETTRGKMEQLQLLLLERRERRRARREAKASPYTSSIITSPSTSSANNSSTLASNWLASSSSPILLHQTPPSNNTTAETNADSADYIQLSSEPVAI